MLEDFERTKIADYYTRTTNDTTPTAKPASVVITHLLPERPTFLEALARITDLRSVLPKPKSINTAAYNEVSSRWRCDQLGRTAFASPDKALAYLEARAPGERLVLLDVGGYFSAVLPQLCDRFSGQILGVVEDSENGHRRYL